MSDSEEEIEKINLSEIKKLDPWILIETYFRDNPNYKTQHQTDSFNEFIFSKTNGIEYIIKRENPIQIYKDIINVADSSLNNAQEGAYQLYEISQFDFIERPMNDICPITRDSFYNNQNVYMICKCKHIFNKTALNMWLEQNDICPYCRTSVRL